MPTDLSIHDEESKRVALAFVSGLSVDGKKWRVEIKRHVKRRTLSQNAALWMWHSEMVDAVGKDTGNDAEDLHEHFKKKFLTPIITEIGGEISKRYSTKKLTTKEMSEFMDRIYAYVTGDLGIWLPHPADYGRDAA